MRISQEDYKKIVAKRLAKKPKFGNVKKEFNGRTFDSTKELNRYQDLLVWQSSGQITELECQRSFDIEVNGHYIGFYVSDFTYKKDGRLVVEDVKSKVTRKLPLYRWKKKLTEAIHGLEIVEI